MIAGERGSHETSGIVETHRLQDGSTVLQRFWRRALDPGFSVDPNDPVDRWNEEIKLLHGYGIGIETALQFLYFQRPGLEGFQQWVQENRRDHGVQPEAVTEDVLSAEDLAFWDKNGYVVIKDAVSREQSMAAQRAIWEFLEASPDDPASWYKPHDARNGLMVKFFDHPALHVNRRSGRICKAFQQLYGSTAISKNIDKVSFNPPEQGSGFRFVGSPLHWDVSLVLPIPLRLQGLLYLTDCSADDGAFHCVPGFQHQIEKWLQSLPPDCEPRKLAPQLLKPVPVPGNAGDFVVWHQALPHCATPNHGRLPRMVQYLTYLPDAPDELREWI
ncbi:MAG TPA: phytanoyl-CoA dioxygenase family protein [Burkholderiaceae bacterium]